MELISNKKAGQYLDIPPRILKTDNEIGGSFKMNNPEKWPFNVEARRRSLFPGEDPDIGQISEEKLLFLFDVVLTTKQKAVFVDRYRDGLTAAETADKENINRSRVYELDRIIFRKLNEHKGRMSIDQSRISESTRIPDVVPSVRICRSLQRLGIETIGDLRALKKESLSKRSGWETDRPQPRQDLYRLDL